jgi:hypothetical protein
MQVIKAISLWQPWASFVILGIKGFETRSWDTNVRGEIGIHAAKKVIPFDDAFGHLVRSIEGQRIMDYLQSRIIEAYGDYKNLPVGAVLGTVNLKDTFSTEIRNKLSYIERVLGDYSPGRFAWQLKDQKLFDTPIPVSGHQGFWDMKI